MAYTRTMNGKVPQVLQELHFDETPTPGSLNPVTSGGVAGSVAQQSSNIAPDYTKKTYEANSYVMHGGVLYTNPNAIGTAEDWNPAHWTQTTVAEMMANAGGGYTTTYREITLNSNQSLDIGEREVCRLKVTSLSNIRSLTLNCSTDCVIRIYSNGQDFELLLKDKNGVDLATVTYYPYQLDLDYTMVAGLDESYAEVSVVSDATLSRDESSGGRYCYIHVTGDVALVLWSGT